MGKPKVKSSPTPPLSTSVTEESHSYSMLFHSSNLGLLCLWSECGVLPTSLGPNFEISLSPPACGKPHIGHIQWPVGDV